MRFPLISTAACLLLPLAAAPSPAQYLAPVGVRPFAVSAMHPIGETVAMVDTVPTPGREDRGFQTVVGGLVGGTLGTAIGLAIASRSHMNCRGDFCGLYEGLLGIAIGEPIGLAIGAHLGSRSGHLLNLAATSAASAGILVGGTIGAVAMGGPVGGLLMMALAPVFQLSAARAIESR